MGVIYSHSPEETEALAFQFAETLAGGERVGLSGPLGVGKTRFMQVVARALPLSEDEPLASPSYPIINAYPLLTGGTLYHIDLYSLERVEDFVEIGGMELFAALDEKSFVFIEWADRYPEVLAALDWQVALRESGEAGEREIEIIDLRR